MMEVPGRSRLCYPNGALAAAYLRTGLGSCLTVGPALFLDLPIVSLAILSLLALMFAISAIQTRRQQRLRLIRDDKGLTILPAGDYLAFEALNSVRLDYFSTRRDGENGWMQLRLGSPRVKLTVDSRLRGFEVLVGDFLAHAQRKGLDFSPATMDNFEAIRSGRFRHRSGPFSTHPAGP